MSDRLRERRATRRRIVAERKALRQLKGLQLRFDLTIARPDAELRYDHALSGRAVLLALRETALSVAREASRDADQVEGTTITISGLAPRPSSRGTVWETIHLCQTKYARGAWWQSSDGEHWTICDDITLTSSTVPATLATKGLA